MALYHAYSARTSDGKECVNGYSHKQMMKFIKTPYGLSPWLLEQKMDEEGNPILRQKVDAQKRPVTVTIEHKHEEIDFAHEAQARGLRAVPVDAMGKVKQGVDKPYARTFAPVRVNDKWDVAEVEPAKAKTAEELAMEAEIEAEELEKQAAAARAKVAALKKKAA